MERNEPNTLANEPWSTEYSGNWVSPIELLTDFCGGWTLDDSSVGELELRVGLGGLALGNIYH